MKEAYLLQYGSLVDGRWRWLVAMVNQREMNVVVGCEDKNGRSGFNHPKREEKQIIDLLCGRRMGEEKRGGEEVMLLSLPSPGSL